MTPEVGTSVVTKLEGVGILDTSVNDGDLVCSATETGDFDGAFVSPMAAKGTSTVTMTSLSTVPSVTETTPSTTTVGSTPLSNSP